jgi:mRNA-degrading endonuclease toxin of MazEF toxin-antitoxin module
MTVARGEVYLARFPHSSGGRGKKRPVVVVQADSYNQTLRHVLVAEVTTNLSGASDPAQLLVEITTPEGAATGFTQNSVITCLHLASISADRIDRKLGELSPGLLQQVGACLKAALGLP